MGDIRRLARRLQATPVDTMVAMTQSARLKTMEVLSPHSDAHIDVEQSAGALPPAADGIAEGTNLTVAPVNSVVALLPEDPQPLHPPVSLVHSSEITSRAFPKAFRGLDEDSVYAWLEVVEGSHQALEEELERLRQGWDELLINAARALNSSRQDPATRKELIERLAASRPSAEIEETATGFSRSLIEGALKGRQSARAALRAAATQLARMQHQTALLRRSNEELRSTLISLMASVT
jgi:DivIVA domain-containing protein